MTKTATSLSFRREPQDVTLGGPPLRIAADGSWWRGDERYDMDNPRHERIVKLLATILRRDDEGAYWLTNPVEKCRITVDDTPFLAVEVIIRGEGRAQELDFRTNLDDVVALGGDHPLVLPASCSSAPPSIGPGQEKETPVPRILMPKGLAARLSRNVFYELVGRGEEGESEVGGKRQPVIGIWSRNQFYPLGLL